MAPEIPSRFSQFHIVPELLASFAPAPPRKNTISSTSSSSGSSEI